MIRRLNVVLVLALAGFTAWGYNRLPAQIPVHFDITGTPDRMGSRISFLILPCVGIATIAVLYVVTRFAVRNPRLINLPDKKRFLELPEAEQRWVIEPVTTSIDWLITYLAVLFLVIELAMFRGAAGADTGTLMQITLITTIIGGIALPLVMLVQVQRRMNQAVRRSSQHVGTVR
jgi:uncharacterized membrane protein